MIQSFKTFKEILENSRNKILRLPHYKSEHWYSGRSQWLGLLKNTLEVKLKLSSFKKYRRFEFAEGVNYYYE